MLDALLGQLEEQCGWLVGATMAPQSGLHAFDFLGSSILAAVDQQVFSTMPGQPSSVITSLLSQACPAGGEGGKLEQAFFCLCSCVGTLALLLVLLHVARPVHYCLRHLRD